MLSGRMSAADGAAPLRSRMNDRGGQHSGKQMRSRGKVLFAAMVNLTTALACVGTAGAATFGAPVALSQNGHAATVNVAIDDSGNALATWADEGMWYSTRPSGGSWSAPQSVYVGGAFPVMHSTSGGSATIVSYVSGSGIWSVDRQPGGAWTSPALIVSAPEIQTPLIQNVSPVQFLSNLNGDQAVVFQQSAGSTTTITAVRRPAGGTWGAEDTVATSTQYGNLSIVSSSLGADGDLVVTFETYTVTCDRSCHDYNFAVHASREKSGTTQWIDSGALTPQSTPYFVRSMIDATGHAGVLIQNGFSATIQATTQAKAGAAWSPLVNAYTGTGSDGAMMWDTEAGKGWGDLAFVYLGTGGASATVLNGNLAKNAWPAANNLSINDGQSANDNMVFATTVAGGAVAEWTDADGTVRAALRKKASSKWSNAQTIVGGSACDVGGVVCTGAVAAATNSSGHSVIGYIRFDPSVTVATLYVATE